MTDEELADRVRDLARRGFGSCQVSRMLGIPASLLADRLAAARSARMTDAERRAGPNARRQDARSRQQGSPRQTPEDKPGSSL